MKTNDCIYHEDILKHLRDTNSIPKVINITRDYLIAIEQAMANAADEIEKLRKENKHLHNTIKHIKEVNKP